MKWLGRLILLAAIAFALLQLIRPGIPERPATAEVQASPEVRQILDKSCYTCHSGQRRLLWFDQIVPAYWLVRHDVLTAREHLDFSTLGAKPAAAQKATLYEAVNMVQLGAMPLANFVQLHPDAKVTPQDLEVLKTYLAPWGPLPAAAANSANVGETKTAGVSLDAVSPEFDGFPFDPSFESWKPISFTDRGDNNTFRFILGNDVAIKAARSGNISPWPEGTRFAKIAWQQELGPDGLVYPGKFVQVELMVKDAARYRATDGWGWGRWRGLDLKPYGNDAHFVSECTGCHLPVRGDDFVYTMPVTAVRFSRDQVVNNNAAALPASLPFQPLERNAITMFVDRKNLTMSTLFGNDEAIHAIWARVPGDSAPSYPPGAVLALVTWAQRDDPHWFGARIPDIPRSVEFIEVGARGTAARYRRFAGPGLVEDRGSPDAAALRADALIKLEPARLP